MTPEELLSILEVSADFTRTDLVDMLSKPCSTWLVYAEQKQSAYKSGRPELLKDVEHFRNLAKEKNIEAVFDEVLAVSIKFEKKCKDYLSNGFHTYVVANTLND